MKFLHTADWHIGKTLKNRNRLPEQAAVLAEIVGHAREHDVDAVLIAGDVYDHAAPSAGAQQLVVRTLLELHESGIEVVVIAGNHDHPETFEAYRPLMHAVGIHLIGHVHAPDNGGLVSLTSRRGERANVALMPFLPARYIVRAAQAAAPQWQNTGRYDVAIREILVAFAGAFTDDAVNVVLAHLTVLGGSFGGGERLNQSVLDYVVPGAVFPPEAHYVALGHLHRRQQVPAECPVHYSGSPLAVDFGEQDNAPQVLLVEATPDTPAVVTSLPITAARRLRTVTGTGDQVLAEAEGLQEDYLRVVLTEQLGPQTRTNLEAAFPDMLTLQLAPAVAPTRKRASAPALDVNATALSLFDRFCAEREMADPRVSRLFAELQTEVDATVPSFEPLG